MLCDANPAEKKQRIQLSPKRRLGILSRRVEVGVVQVVSDDDEVDIAASGVGPPCYRAEHEGALDPVRIGLERFLDRLRQADGLFDQPSQLFKNRGSMVRSVVLLVADAFDRHEAALLQLRQFACDSTDSGTNVSHDLQSVEAALRMTENEREDALLYF
jgi:hypothetical protein